MTRQEAELILQKTFGLSEFYDEQWQTIDKILQGKRILLIEKTGFGKSLCFQFPAIVFSGMTVIFSPLIALMRDQVKKLQSLGITAKCINSEQSQKENAQTIADAKQGKIKILYIAPERQEDSRWIEAIRKMNLSMVVVDEAHCISVWGHDFRPAFKRIINLVKLLPKGLPVFAATATATKRVEKDIATQIGEDIMVIRGNLMRDNFRLFVIKVRSESEKMIWLGKNIEKMPGSGILYTGTRIGTEFYFKWFEHLKISSIAYNAGLDSDMRIAIENGFMDNKWKCIVSTNALGMGIDKPNIRFVIHTQIPQSPVHYYQEIGRAGRNGEISYVILFYNPDEDKKLPTALIESSRPSIKKYEIVINAIKLDMFGFHELSTQINLKQTELRTILADLMEQGIVRETMYDGQKKYEYIFNTQPLDTLAFEELHTVKLKELDSMIEYAETTTSRMQFLCDYLGDISDHSFTNCDNTGQKKLKVIITPEWIEKLKDFEDNFFPVLEVKTNKSNLVDGVAASYYGLSNVGSTIHQSKYGNGGDFPDFLLKMTLRAFRKKLGNEHFDIILYVPPTAARNLVKNFAEKIAMNLQIPLSHKLVKIRSTQKQKIFKSVFSKKENIKNAFNYLTPDEIAGKNILLIDDIFDSGATIKEIGKLLTKMGAKKITPLVIARTIGGNVV
ncbi:MAG: RecQ family ATP-dependent DNA helicase [Bacteroidales bacterium]|jgi:ATP-dependent DNA helicase RecQ|nr:RecQ family ATP-dependent DNA helicase [Bacteroidales bacterium]